MAIQFSVSVRNARLDAIESTIGAAPTLELRTGPAPANCAAADSGTLVAVLALPADWMLAAANGAKALANGPWQDLSADNAGLIGHFRVKAAAVCHMQGTAGEAATDLILDNADVNAGQAISITGFTLTDNNG